MASLLGKARQLAADGLYNQALALLDTEPAETLLLPEALVLKAELIQVSSDDSTHNLSEVPELYQQAAALAPQSYEPLYELGMYWLDVQDDPATALRHLRAASAILTQQIKEVEEALAQADEELNGDDLGDCAR